MKILITNDDGINAPGLKVLADIARTLSDDVWIVVPDTNQSGASHSLTLNESLRCSEVGEKTFAVRGTPTDCVIMGVRHILLKSPPDLILSGVNRGSNIAEDVTYSGTIAGAIEGSLLGIRSIAMSQSIDYDAGDIHWETGLAHGPEIVKRLLATDWNPAILMNVNFPPFPPQKVGGVMVTVQGKRDQAQLHIECALRHLEAALLLVQLRAPPLPSARSGTSSGSTWWQWPFRCWAWCAKLPVNTGGVVPVHPRPSGSGSASSCAVRRRWNQPLARRQSRMRAIPI